MKHDPRGMEPAQALPDHAVGSCGSRAMVVISAHAPEQPRTVFTAGLTHRLRTTIPASTFGPRDARNPHRSGGPRVSPSACTPSPDPRGPMALTSVIHPGIAGLPARRPRRSGCSLRFRLLRGTGTPMAQVPRKTKINGPMAPSRGQTARPRMPRSNTALGGIPFRIPDPFSCLRPDGLSAHLDLGVVGATSSRRMAYIHWSRPDPPASRPADSIAKYVGGRLLPGPADEAPASSDSVGVRDCVSRPSQTRRSLASGARVPASASCHS